MSQARRPKLGSSLPIFHGRCRTLDPSPPEASLRVVASRRSRELGPTRAAPFPRLLRFSRRRRHRRPSSSRRRPPAGVVAADPFRHVAEPRERVLPQHAARDEDASLQLADPGRRRHLSAVHRHSRCPDTCHRLAQGHRQAAAVAPRHRLPLERKLSAAGKARVGVDAAGCARKTSPSLTNRPLTQPPVDDP